MTIVIRGMKSPYLLTRGLASSDAVLRNLDWAFGCPVSRWQFGCPVPRWTYGCPGSRWSIGGPSR